MNQQASGVVRFLFASVVTACAMQAQLKDFVIPHFAIGDGWSSRLTLGYQPWLYSANCQAVFKNPSGTVVRSVALPQKLADPILFAETYTGGALQTGHIEFMCDNPLFDPAQGLLAYVVFSYKKDGIQYEAAAAADRVGPTKTLLIDGSDQHRHGIAVYNHSRFAALIGFTLTGVTGDVLQTGDVNLGPYQQSSFTLESVYPDLAGAIGTMVFTDTATVQKMNISVVGFRFNAQGQFTNIPVR